MHYYEVIKLIIITNLQKHGEMCMLCKIKLYDFYDWYTYKQGLKENRQKWK